MSARIALMREIEAGETLRRDAAIAPRRVASSEKKQRTLVARALLMRTSIMPGIVAECVRPHVLGEHRIHPGTRALVIGATVVPVVAIELQITDPDHTDLRVGDVLEVPATKVHGFWRTMKAS